MDAFMTGWLGEMSLGWAVLTFIWVVLLAYRRDGKELSSQEGPFRIIAPGEKRHARWVRNVTSVSIKRASE